MLDHCVFCACGAVPNVFGVRKMSVEPPVIAELLPKMSSTGFA